MKRCLWFVAVVVMCFCAAFSVSCADDWQFSVARHEGQGISRESWEFAVTSQPSQVAENRSAASGEDYYVVLYGTEWCGPCAAWKTLHMPRLVKAGVSVTVIDCDRSPEWKRSRTAKNPTTGQMVVVPGVTSFPTIEIVRKSDRWPVARFLGGSTAQSILTKIESLRAAHSASSDALSMRWNIAGDWTPSLQQTLSHLREIHNFDATGMTLQQMLTLHDALHDKTSS